MQEAEVRLERISDGIRMGEWYKMSVNSSTISMIDPLSEFKGEKGNRLPAEEARELKGVFLKWDLRLINQACILKGRS